MEMNNMKKFMLGNRGVSEIIGTVLLLAIAVTTFSVFAIYVMSSTSPSTSSPNLNIAGYLTEDGHVILEHKGGESIELNQVRVTIRKGEVDSLMCHFNSEGEVMEEYAVFNDSNPNGRWDVGEYLDVSTASFGNITNWQISAIVIDENSNSIIFTGILQQGILRTVPPVAIFTYAPWDPKTQEIVEFNASQSYDPDGGQIVSYSWDFGDGHTGSGMVVVHQYTTPDVYNITLTITDDEGETTVAVSGHGFNVPSPINVTENIPPIANFTWEADPEIDGTINFYSSASDPDGAIVSYFWNFGDGNTSSNPTPSHTYSHSGDYTVTLIVTDDNGGYTTVELTVTVPNILPVAGFSYTPRNITTARSVVFDGGIPYSYDKDGSIVNWTWDFDGNGIIDAYGPTVSHLYPTPGNYTVILNVTDNDGGWDTYEKNITVYSPAVASSPRFLIVDNTPIGWESGIDNIIAACQSIMPESEFSYGKAIDQWTFTNDEYTSPDLRGQNITDTVINQFDIVIWSTGDFPGDGGNANWDGNANTWSTPMTEGYDDTSNHVHELAEHLTGNVTAGTLLLCGTYAVRDLQDYPGNGANSDEIWLGNVLGLVEPTGGIHYDPDWVPFSGRLGNDEFRGEPYHIVGSLVGFSNTSSGQIGVATINITSPIDAYALYKQSDSLFKYSLEAGGGSTEVELLNEDMETNPGWTTGGSKDEWDWGICKGGPGVAHSGSRCYGTDMSGADYRYNNNAYCYVRTGWIDLDGYTSATLQFYDWYMLEDGYDYVYLQVYDDDTWSWHTIASFTGSQESWTQKSYDLSSYVGKSIRIRWLLDSDSSVGYDGYYLDDVVLTATQEGVPAGYYAIDAERGRNRTIVLGFDLNADEITEESRTNYLRNVLAWLAEGAGYATEVWVNNDPPEGWLDDPTHVDSIQTGISAVPPGGRVYVIGTDGQVYNENVVVDKSIDLIGIDSPTIMAGGTNVVDVESDWVRIDGFRIEGDGAENGIYVGTSARCTIINCTISNVSKMGVYLDNSHNNTIQNNTIRNALYGIYGSWSFGNRIINNDIYSNTGGIYLYKSSLSNILGNTIHNNEGYGGIYMESLEQCYIFNNTIINNSGDGVHMISSTNRNTIERNIFQENLNGIHLEISNSNMIYNNTIQECDNGMLIEDFSNSNTVRGNTITSNDYGMNIQNSSNNGILYNEISQNNYGIYLLSSTSNSLQANTIVNNTGDGLILTSSADNNLIYSCTIQENLRGVYIYSSVNNTLEKNIISQNNGDGVYLSYSMSGFSGENRVINNTIFSNNGTGIYLYSSDGNILDKNEIYSNVDGGIRIIYSSDENIISNNTVYDVPCGVYFSKSHYNSMSNNTLHHIAGNAIAMFSYSSENQIRDNIINDSDEGLHLEYSNTNTIFNNTIYENTRTGINISSSDLNTLQNNTIYMNGEDGILLLSSDENILTANILHDNLNGIHLVLSGGSGNTLSENVIYDNLAHGIFLENSRTATAGNNEIIGNEIHDNGESGISLCFSNINSIQQNNIYSNGEMGISLNSSDSNTLQENEVYGNGVHGLYLLLSNSNDIQSNNISFNGGSGIYLLQSSQGDSFPIQGNLIWNNSDAGIFINSSGSNYVAHNIIWNNSYGLYMNISSTGNRVYENNITTNTICGVFIASPDCSGNQFYNNNFINNTLYLDRQAYDVGGNGWDNGYSAGGNYWSDYNGSDLTGPESIPDGIGDTPYTIAPSEAGNVDQYPLMEPKKW